VFERTPAATERTPVESRTVDDRGSQSGSRSAQTGTTSESSKSPSSGKASNETQSAGQSAQSETRPDGAPSSSKKADAGSQPAAKRPVAEPAARSASPAATKPYRQGDWRPEYHAVSKGDTLYSIALDYGQEYRDLAKWNELADPSYIRVGQQLRLFPTGTSGEPFTPEPVALPPAALPTVGKPLAGTGQIPSYSDPKAFRAVYTDQAYADLRRAISGETETAVVRSKPPATTAQKSAQASKPAAAKAPKSAQAGRAGLPDERLKWEWPAPGKVLYEFSSGPNKKGVAIQGKPGQAVVSSAPGKVVYSGSGLRGYGNLIIVKHNATYLSVYAHNRQLLVSEGQMVAQGQKIAVMGSAAGGPTALHFEIRRLGKPIDPRGQLPARPS
jgi:lipoprotein NlpD